VDLTRVEQAATELYASYEMFLAALGGRYLATRAAGVEGLRARQIVQLDGYRYARSFVDSAAVLIEGYATRATDGSAVALSDALGERVPELTALLRGAVLRNIRQATDWFTTGQIPVDPFVTSSGAVGLLWQQKMATPEFTLPDAIGRQWKAGVLVRQAARDTFYQSEIDADVARIVAAGGRLVQVNHPTAHDKNGMILSLEEGGAFPTLVSVRDRIFHPNARAALESYNRVSP
jgi:hypothetical protein